jgi:predicted phage replisome organizer
MPDITWIKLSTSIFDDEKIAIIESMPEADSLLVMWVKLLIAAGKCNSGGWIWLEEDRPYSDEMLAAVLRRPLNTVRLALQTFQQLGMVELSGRGILILSWEKHQNVEGMERVRELTRLRVQKHRSNLRALPEGNATPTLSNVTVTGQNKKENKNKNKKENISRRGAAAPAENNLSFSVLKQQLEDSPNQVGFLVSAFKILHPDAPASDMEQAGGRLATLWSAKNRDGGYLLQVIWETSSRSINGSHLNYIQALLARTGSHTTGADPDKFVRGKYGHMVAR